MAATESTAAATHQKSPRATAAAPTIVVDRLHVVYRIVGNHPRGGSWPVLPRALRKRPATRRVHALRGVSMTVRRGEAVGILGANGSGKSTLLRAIAGLVSPHSGAVYVDGQATLLDVGQMMRDLSGRDNVLLGCLAAGMSREQARQAYPAIAEFAGLGKFLDLPMLTYSTGMVARLRFAIAAATPHEILLIDETVAVGDAEFRRRSAARIQELREAAGSVLVVSHNAASIEEACDRAVWLANGELVADGPADQVVATYEERQEVP
jgi:teichoic acid transport system ATP-binding protein